MLNDQEQLAQISILIANARDHEQAVDLTMEFLHKTRRDYHWVGVYVLKGDILHLGPYRGPKTDHVQIPVGRGVCGTAVVTGQNQIVGDVSTVGNYLACNLDTKSEIVVLIRDPATDQILAQIDVDGRRQNQFDASEEAFLKDVAELLAPLIGEPA